VNLECGKEYRGTLNLASLTGVTVTTSGTCGKAIINAAQPVSGWQSSGGNIWSAPLSFVPNQVVMQGKLLELAHTARVNGNPYLTVKAQSGTTLTLQGLSINGDVTGAAIRVRDSQFTITDGSVTSGNASVVTTSGISGNLVGWGAYLEGKRWMLDEPGEWVYESGILYIYSATQPQAVEAAGSNAAINARNSKSLTLENIIVKNAVTNIEAQEAVGLTLRNIEVLNATDYGIDANCASNIIMTGSSVTNIGRDGLKIGYCGDNVKVDNSKFTNIGTVMMPRKSEAAIFGGLTTNMTVTASTFTNVGYIAIRFFRNSLIDGNTINGACVTLDDCGGIYTYDRDHIGLSSTISNNRISNVNGSMLGNGTNKAAYGIYLDDGSNGVTVSGNTVSSTLSGILLHAAFNNVVESNSFSGNTEAHVYMGDYNYSGSIRGNIFRYNNYAAGKTYLYGVEAGDNTALWASYLGNLCAAGAIGCK
jgi:parallel beta-helix repeat protein